MKALGRTAVQASTRPAVTTASQGSHAGWHLTLELLWMLASREITIRYKQSLMGFLWALFMPALVVMAGLVVRSAMSHLTGTALAADAVAAMTVKALPWAFFVSGIRAATTSLTANSNLVTRARCPRIVFPLAAILSALFDLAVAAVPVVVVLVIVGTPVSLQLLWIAPLLILLVALVAGLGIALAAANLFFRDVKYIVEVVLMFAIFFTPVLFEARMLGAWQSWLWLNPITPILEGLYAAVVQARSPDLAWIGYSALVSALLLVGSLFLFFRLEPAFADSI